MRILAIIATASLAFGVARAAENEATSVQACQVDRSERIGTPTQVEGRVLSTHTVELTDPGEAHVLVKLESDQGETRVVDLGAASTLKNSGIDPQVDQELFVDGRAGRMNEKPIVIAERISTAKIVQINRNAPLRTETQKHADNRASNASTDNTKDMKQGEPKAETTDPGMPMRTVEGTIMHTRNVAIQGEAEEHVLAKITVAAGGIVVIDLGPRSTLPKVNLDEGQSLAATGVIGRLNEKPIILADSVGNLSSIERAEKPTSVTAPDATK